MDIRLPDAGDRVEAPEHPPEATRLAALCEIGYPLAIADTQYQTIDHTLVLPPSPRV